MKILTKLEAEQFNTKGFLLKRNLFDKKRIKIIQNEIKKLAYENKSKKIDKYFSSSIFNKRKYLLVRIENFYKKNKNLTKIIDDKIIYIILTNF